MPAVRRVGTAEGGEKRTLRVVHEEAPDEAQLEVVAGGSKDQQTSCGRITVTSAGLRSGIRIIGGNPYPESDTL